MVAHVIHELIPQIIDLWRSEDVTIRSGVSASDLNAFEGRWGISLPHDMREFYASVDGMEEDETVTDELFRFWPLERVMPIPDLLPESHYASYREIDDNARHLCFADYMIDSDVYAIFADGDADNCPVIAVCSGHRRVADNFTDFVCQFLRDRFSLF